MTSTKITIELDTETYINEFTAYCLIQYDIEDTEKQITASFVLNHSGDHTTDILPQIIEDITECLSDPEKWTSYGEDKHRIRCWAREIKEYQQKIEKYQKEIRDRQDWLVGLRNNLEVRQQKIADTQARIVK